MITTTKRKSDFSQDEIERLRSFASEKPVLADDGKVLSEFSALMEDYKAGYFGGGSTRFLPAPKNTNPLGSNADSHYPSESSYFMMVERSRFFDRDNMFFGAGLNRVIASVLQNGFNLQAKTGDDALDAELENGWHERGVGFDHENELDFDTATQCVFRHVLVDGDVVAIPIGRTGKVEIRENHHLRNPYGQRSTINTQSKTGIIHGVEINNGQRVAYHLTPDTVGTGHITKRFESKRYDAYSNRGQKLIHQLYFPKRKSQHRGVGVAAPIVFPLQYNDDLQFSAMVNAKKQHFLAIVHEFDLRGEYNPNRRKSELQSGTMSELLQSEQAAGRNRRPLTDGTPGQEYWAEAGEKVNAFSATAPAPQHFPHTELLMTITAINLGLPLIVLLLDGSKTNFNGFRGAISEARQGFRQIQRWLIKRWHSEIYKFYVRWRLKNDPRLRTFIRRRDLKILNHEWTPQSWEYIQPIQDAAADDLQIDRNLTSPRRIAKSRAMEWKVLADEITADRALLIENAIKKADAINKRFPDANVNWRELAFGNKTSPVSLNLNGQIDGDVAPADEPEPKPANEPAKQPIKQPDRSK